MTSKVLNINADSKGGERTNPKPGTTQGVLIGMYDVGTQQPYDASFKPRREIILTWALPKQVHVFDEEKGPEMMYISRTFSLSLHKKSALRPIVEAITGKSPEGDYNVFELLGTNCLLNLKEVKKENGDVFVNVATVTPLMEENTPIEGMDGVAFSVSDYTAEDVANLPEWIATKAKKAPEFVPF